MPIFQQLVIWLYLLFLSLIPTLVSYFTQWGKSLKSQTTGVQVLNFFFSLPSYTILRKFNSLSTKNVYELMNRLTKPEFDYLMKNYNVKLNDYKLIKLLEESPSTIFALFSSKERKALYSRVVTPDTKYELMPLLGYDILEHDEMVSIDPEYFGIDGPELYSVESSKYEFADSARIDFTNDKDIILYASVNGYNKMTGVSGIIPSKYVDSHLKLCNHVFNKTKPKKLSKELEEYFTVVGGYVLTYLVLNDDNQMFEFHGRADKMAVAKDLFVRPIRFENSGNNLLEKSVDGRLKRSADFKCYGGIKLFPNKQLIKNIDSKYMEMMQDTDIDINIVPVKVRVEDVYFNDGVLYTYYVSNVLVNANLGNITGLDDLFDKMDHSLERSMRKKLM